MQPVFHDINQNTDEWLELRRGKFTASTFKDLFMGAKTAGYEKAIYQPVFEKLTNESPESFSSSYMQRGHELEPLAVEHYEMETFTETKPGGFWSMGEWLGASPDRLIDDDGLLEIKSPAFNTQINYLLKGTLPKIYHWQVHGQLYITNRQYCDFIAYHPKLKPLIIRIDRDEKIIDELELKLTESIKKAKDIFNRIKKL